MSLPEPVPEAKPRLRRPARLKYDSLRQTELLLLPERVVSLNATAAAILRLCDGQRTVSEIVGELESAYGQTDLKGDVLEFLMLAADRGWVEP
ncbi:pyrroloquinoline quinone biosynthesis peptide chaperone PqqD [Cohnella lubricantis]|uniref:Pyrroloquinoline quinone biosynthesis peptide chaperone PqqD n=1 Tax=Cohnella lubricantis TaxID=2163172 RepID=A0A841TAI2_9BACL|nr:pyrroloquinoline quinone biosynthesis peptide chaperone PqqD [Cohnella lubricantis]MBB6676037.1 pyrroloquinoline quinone biosynthesis peptide chaperone PqqD [Cohnella lubricantis]MBP2117992.1 pyrroloquinoline quinone biosynthesis protein D [Cohnella lubricantis]